MTTNNTNQQESSDQLDKQELQNLPPELTPVANVSFTLLLNGKIHIDCEWILANQDVAKYLGELIYYITNGCLDDGIKNRILSHNSQNILLKSFVQNVLKSWETADKTANTHPVISPLSALTTPTSTNFTFVD